MSWGTEKTPEVQKMTENGGDHVLCTTVYILETAFSSSTEEYKQDNPSLKYVTSAFN